MRFAGISNRGDQRHSVVVPEQVEQRAEGGGNENQRLDDQAVDHTRNRGGVLEHPEYRVADFFLGMKADAQFLHASVKVDAEEVADALQNPNPVAEEKSKNEQAADCRDAAEDASVNQDGAPICIERHVQHPRLRRA